ncbi:MAG: NAD(P)-binding protein, partial [Streptomycetaceae bacterium]|nr:NAD(P)-binding protein [Streptomycetaceae bacterium]
MSTSILVSGAGIAGATAAFWLAQAGYAVTVVERAEGARSSGNPVDVRGAAVDVAERMGILANLRAAATDVRRMTLVDAEGRTVTHIGMGAIPGATAASDVEIPRADLARILVDAGRDRVEFIQGDSIRELGQDDSGVDVAFEQASPRRFDLVVGADGLHSTVRRLAFGPEDRFVRPAGMYVATMPVDPSFAARPDEVLLHNSPGRLTSVHPAAGKALAAFIF